MKRSSGILMPVFSFPSRYGIGTFGEEAYKFIDYISDIGVKYWQVLPMHPLTYGNSPYQSTSTFAGNIYYIDLDMLKDEGLLLKSDYDKVDFGDDKNKIDYNKIIKNKTGILRKAAENFLKNIETEKELRDLYTEFKNNNKYFLEEFCIFTVIKERYGGKLFGEWDKIHRLHFHDVIEEFSVQNAYDIEIEKVLQYLFFSQWIRLKNYANEKGILIIGDMPIYSPLDSAEVFSKYENFLLDSDRRPKFVAGCPPDAFSSDGQLWGNPLYDYDYMEKDGYSYFVERLKHLSKLFDMIRIDHFRGFASYYTIPASEKSAKNGFWKIGPGIKIFDILKKEIPNLDIMAEDLGIIDDTVSNLLDETGFPGMKVVEFAFGGDDVENHKYLPKNYNENSVAYLGTHDNNTFIGWLNDEASSKEKEQAIKFLHLDSIGKENLDAITELYKSKSNLTIVMMQDLLGLSSEARINTPSTVGDYNWSYRFRDNYLDRECGVFLQNLIKSTKR